MQNSRTNFLVDVLVCVLQWFHMALALYKLRITLESHLVSAHSSMKLNMIEDDFDQYFARAGGVGGEAARVQPAEDVEDRRGSLPIPRARELKSSSPRRTASCKYPRRGRRERSHSPRGDASTSPKRPNSINLDTQHHHAGQPGSSPKNVAITDSYIHEATLRAPSPRMGIKCHSAPHSRSSSWKKSKRPRSPRADADVLEGRPRTGSCPLEDTISKLERLQMLRDDDVFIVRNFATSAKGIINRGDSFKKRSSQSVASDGAGSAASGPGGVGEGGDRSRALSVNSQGSTNASSTGAHHFFKVVMTGDHGVGKSALMHQFMTSEYMGATDISFGEYRCINNTSHQKFHTPIQNKGTENNDSEQKNRGGTSFLIQIPP